MAHELASCQAGEATSSPDLKRYRAVFDRLHEPLGIGIEVGSAESDPMDIDAVLFERLLEPARQLGVIVTLSVSG